MQMLVNAPFGPGTQTSLPGQVPELEHDRNTVPPGAAPLVAAPPLLEQVPVCVAVKPVGVPT